MSNIPTAYIVAIPDEDGKPTHRSGHVYERRSYAQAYADNINEYGVDRWHPELRGKYVLFASQGWVDVGFQEMVQDLRKEMQRPSKS